MSFARYLDLPTEIRLLTLSFVLAASLDVNPHVTNNNEYDADRYSKIIEPLLLTSKSTHKETLDVLSSSPPDIDWHTCYPLLHLLELLQAGSVLQNVQNINFRLLGPIDTVDRSKASYAIQIAAYLATYPNLRLYLTWSELFGFGSELPSLPEYYHEDWAKFQTKRKKRQKGNPRLRRIGLLTKGTTFRMYCCTNPVHKLSEIPLDILPCAAETEILLSRAYDLVLSDWKLELHLAKNRT